MVLNEPPTCTARWRSRLSASTSGRPGPPHDPGVVDQDVEPPELLDRGVDERSAAVRCRHVAGVGDGRSPAAAISAATADAGPASAPSPSIEPPRSLTTTRAPRSASRRAWARPMPRPAPVTTATRPSKRCSFTRDPADRPCTVRSSAGNRERNARRSEKWKARRDAIVDTSAQVFAQQGYHATGIAELCDGQRPRQGRVLPLHRVEGGAARRHPRPGDGRGDARRRSGRRGGRIAGRSSWRCSATSCSTSSTATPITSGSSSTSSRRSPPSGPSSSACGAASTSGGSRRSCRPASTPESSATSTPGSPRSPGSACTTTRTCG